MSRVLRIQSVIHVSIISLKNHNVCICEFLPTELTCYTKHVLLTLYCTLVSSLISMLQITIYYLSVTIPVSYHEAQHDCLVHQRFEQPPCITWMVQLRHSLQWLLPWSSVALMDWFWQMDGCAGCYRVGLEQDNLAAHSRVLQHVPCNDSNNKITYSTFRDNDSYFSTKTTYYWTNQHV